MHLSFVQCVGTWLETEREAESNQKLLNLPLVFSSPFSHYFGHWKDMLRPCLQRGTQVGSLMPFVHTQMKKCLHMKYWWHTSELSEVPVTIDQVCHGDGLHKLNIEVLLQTTLRDSAVTVGPNWLYLVQRFCNYSEMSYHTVDSYWTVHMP